MAEKSRPRIHKQMQETEQQHQHQRQQHQHQRQQHQRQHHHHQQQHQHQRRVEDRSAVVTAHDVEEEVISEMIPLPFRKAYDMAEKMATTRIGQFMIARGDRLLKIVETTAKWSLPPDQIDAKLQRPLPWIPFLMMIVLLRCARIWISIGALFIGNAPVKAQDVVYFVQTRRRKLRALRLRGIKEICRRETEQLAQKCAYGETSFVAQLKRFFSSAICRPGQHREPERRIMIHRGKEVICVDSDRSEHQSAKRPRSEECEADMSLHDLINKYANENTDDDSDFVPNHEEAVDDSDTTSETSSESTDETETLTEEISSKYPAEKNYGKNNNRLSSRHKDTTSPEKSIEFHENGKDSDAPSMVEVPKPLIEVKMEICSDSDSGAGKPKTMAHQNGSGGNGVENREVDIAFKFVLTPPGMENGNKNHLATTMEIEKSYKATSGNNRIVAETSQHRQQTDSCQFDAFDAATAAAHEKEIPIVDITDTDISSDATLNDTDNYEIIKINTKNTNTNTKNDTKTNTNTISTNSNINCNRNPSIRIATAPTSSATSLDSLIANDDKLLSMKETYAMATSTPEKRASISSSEDDFYSLIGSPPDFNAFLQQIQKQQQIEQQQQQQQLIEPMLIHASRTIDESEKTVSEPHIGHNQEVLSPITPTMLTTQQNFDQQETVSESPHTDESSTSDTRHSVGPAPTNRRNQHQHQPFHHNNQNRWRGRNKRN